MKANTLTALFVLALTFGAVPARAQDDRTFWLNRLSEMLAREPNPDAAYDRWMGEWFSALKPTGGLTGAMAGTNTGPVRSADFWGDIGEASLNTVRAASRVALDTYMRDPNDPSKLARLEALEALRSRVAYEHDAAVATSYAGTRVDGGWDRDGDGIADVIDADGDGSPDTYLGATSAAAYTGPRRLVPPIVGNTIRGKQFNPITWPSTPEPSEKKKKDDDASAGEGEDGEGGGRVRTGDALANLPTLREVSTLATKFEEETATLERALGRLQGGGDAAAGREAVASVERLRVLTSELTRAANRLPEELGRSGVDREGALRAITQVGTALSTAEDRMNAALQIVARAEGSDPVLDRVGAGLESLFPEFEATAQLLSDAIEAMGYDMPDHPASESGGMPSGAVSLGTGFAVGDGRCVLTNAHVVGKAETVTITLHSGEEIEARVIANGASSQLDLALIELPRSIGRGLAFAPDAAREGIPVWAVGFGEIKGTAPTCLWTDGTISAVPARENIIFSATVNPGNSGGPLVDARGCFVGVVVAKSYANVEDAVDSMSFAVPGAAAQSFLQENGVQVERTGGVSNQPVPERDRVRAVTVMITARQP
jgi:S1-C subfamily serine protease